MRLFYALATSAALALAWIGVGPILVTAQSAPLALSALSSRPDMVTGGDALVEVRGVGTSAAGLGVTIDGRDVTSSFAPDSARGTLTGVVSGLRVGASTIEASAGTRTARLAVSNFPVTGPVFSGPHLDPFVCRTEESGLGAPL